MNIKMASEEDFTITTKGGHTITFPDRDGTVATESATPVKPATSGQAQTIIDELGNQTHGLSAIRTTVEGIIIPNDYATNAQATSIVNKLDSNMYGLSTIMGKVCDNYSVIQGLDAVLHDPNHGNSALKTKLNTIDNRLTDSTNGLTKIREAADAAKDKAIDIYTLAEGGTGFDAIYNELTDHEHGLNELSGAIAGIANDIGDPMHGLMAISGELVDIKTGVNSIRIPSDYATSTQATSIINKLDNSTYGLQAIYNGVGANNAELTDQYHGLSVINNNVSSVGGSVNNLQITANTIEADVYDITNKESVIYVAETTRDMLQHPANGLTAIKGAVNSIDASVSSISSDVTAIGCGIWDIQHHSTYGLEQIKNVLDDTYHDCSGAYAIVDNQDYGNSSLKTRLATLSGTLGDVQTVLDNINGTSI